jgi:hypothetical protein
MALESSAVAPAFPAFVAVLGGRPTSAAALRAQPLPLATVLFEERTISAERVQQSVKHRPFVSLHHLNSNGGRA